VQRGVQHKGFMGCISASLSIGAFKTLTHKKKKEKNLVQLFITTVLSKMGYWLATYSNNIFITKNSQTLQHTNKKKSDNKVWQENNI
jgi:hypothetical protein